MYFDYNNNGDQDLGDANLPNVDVEITNVFGQTSIVETDTFGNWEITVPVGSTISNIDESDINFPTGSIQTEGIDPTETILTAGSSFAETDDGFYLPNLPGASRMTRTSGRGPRIKNAAGHSNRFTGG